MSNVEQANGQTSVANEVNEQKFTNGTHGSLFFRNRRKKEGKKQTKTHARPDKTTTE